METPSTFKDQRKELTQRYNIIIDEIVNMYPNSKINANKMNFNNLENLQKDIFLLKNGINKSTEDLQLNIKEIDEKLYNLEQENMKLREKLALLTNSDNAAHGRLTDSKTLYNQKLLGNWIFSLTLITGIYMIYK